MSLVECELTRVVMSETRHQQPIVLKEKDGHRRMAIMIGPAEVFALHRVINEEHPPRPLTHELFGQVLDALGIQIDRVVVSQLLGRTYYGRLILKQDGKTFDIDSRPSDAIVLATQEGAPIYVDEEVLARAAEDL